MLTALIKHRNLCPIRIRINKLNYNKYTTQYPTKVKKKPVEIKKVLSSSNITF